MKEIWDLALSPVMLPLTILLAPVGIYWLLSVIGAASHGLFHGHGHGHHVGGGHHHDVGGGHHHHPHLPHHGGHAGHHHGADGHHHHHNGHAERSDGQNHFFAELVHGALRVVNANEVPVMIVLSVLIVLLWGCAMMGNLLLHPDPDGWGTTWIMVGSFFASILFTRLVLIPVKPLFRFIQKEDVEPESPIVGRSGYVRTAFVTELDGQVVVENRGAPIIIGARTGHGAEPISRNAQVLVVNRDPDTGVYIVRPS